MKRALSLLLAGVLACSLMFITAYADSGDQARITINGSDNQVLSVLYGEGADGVDGASYNERTNTMSLNNYQHPDHIIMAERMGDDFKINVTGDCSVQGIVGNANGYGNSINITGSGTMTVNEDRDLDAGISIKGDGAYSQFIAGKDVTLHLYGKDTPVEINKTLCWFERESIMHGDDPVDNISSVKETMLAPETLLCMGVDTQDAVVGHLVKKGNRENSEENGFYVVSEEREINEGDESSVVYFVTRYFYNESMGTYAPDTWVNEYYDTEEEMIDDGYDYETGKNDERIPFFAKPFNFYTCDVYKDQAGKRYAVTQTGKEVYDLNEEAPASYDDDEYPLITKNDSIDFNTLTPTEAELPTGLYSYKVAGTELILSPIPHFEKESVSLKAGSAVTAKVKNGSAVSFKSSNVKVASVSKTGKVTALKKGSAKITATLNNGDTVSCSAKVTTNPSIKVNGKLFKKAKVYKVSRRKYLKISINGKAASVKNVYKTSNRKIAKVASARTSKAPKIKGLRAGKATVTITVNGVPFKIKVIVK